MRINGKRTVTIWIVGVLLLIAGRSDATERALDPLGLFYYQPAASVFGSEAVWVNPAGLAVYRVSAGQVMAEHKDSKFAKSWGMVSCQEVLGTAYRSVDRADGQSFKEYIFAGGGGLGQMNLGGSYCYYKDGPPGILRRHSWNIGLMGRVGRSFSWGAVFSNLNHAMQGGERSPTEQRYSLSYRPFDERLTIAADMFLSTAMNAASADYIYHAEARPIPGLYLTGAVDSDKNWQVGCRINLHKYFVGSESRFDRQGDHSVSTAWIGVSSMRQKSILPQRKRRLQLSLSGRPRENPSQPIFGRKPTPFITLIREIYRASDDRSISAMTITNDRCALGLAQAQELRRAMEYFRSQGKSVICHLGFPGNIGYYVAAAADSVFISPVSQLNLVGLKAELTFYAGTLDKLGLNLDIMRIGEYKTAAESFTERAASPENREQINRLLDDIYRQFVFGISEGRGLSEDSVRAIIDNGPYTSTEALECGLVDGLSYRDELEDRIGDRRPVVSFRNYLADTVVCDRWQARPKLAVVVAEGEIGQSRSGLSPFGSPETVTPFAMQKAFSQALADPSVEGIVLRISSPGGGALAGDAIYHAVAKAAEEKPLVVSMGNVAASGGYYIAMPASYVFADSGSITGSVGIFGGKLDASGLYRKIDLGKELYTRGRFSAMLSSVRPFTENERQKYHSHLSAFYNHFLDLVATNRSLTVDSVDNLARGRVWTGREAFDHGLVDRLGGLKQALDFSADRLGLREYDVVIHPQRRPLFVLPGGSLIKVVTSMFTDSSDPVSVLTGQAGLGEPGGLYTRMPYDIVIE